MPKIPIPPELEDYRDDAIDRVFDRVDSALERGANKITFAAALFIDKLMAPKPPNPNVPPHSARNPRPPNAAPPPRPAAEDPRDVLGFDDKAKLTRAMVKDRKRELLKLMHPDKGGSTKATQRIIAAADRLLETLPK